MSRFALLAALTTALFACSEEKKAAPTTVPEQPAAATPPTPPPAPAEPMEPCGVFTKEDASEILGAPIDVPVAQIHSEGAIISCSYPTLPPIEKTPKKKEKTKGVRQPGVDASVPVLTYTAQAAKRTGTKDAAEAVERMKASGASITPEPVDVAGTPAIWVKGPDMLFADKNGWVVATSTTSKTGDRLAMSKALMEKLLPRLTPAPE